MTRFIVRPTDEVLEYIKNNFAVSNGVVYRKDDGFVGNINTHGYSQFKVNFDIYKTRITVSAHHISWFLAKGEWPTMELDHIDRNRLNNDVNNLREVTTREQSVNASHVVDKKSGLPTGVKLKRGRYEVYIRVNGRKVYIGSSKDVEEAGRIYQEYFEALNKNDRGEL